MRRKYKNIVEEAFAALAEKNGWQVTKRGWPDFFCWKGNEFIAVECKPRQKRNKALIGKLKREQANCMDFLSAAGVKCFVSDGYILEVYERNKHRRRKD